MKKEKLMSTLRKKIIKNGDATCYKVNQKEMLDIIKDKMLDKLTDNDKKSLSKPFSYFKERVIEKENDFTFKTSINPNSLLGYYSVYFYTGSDVYSLNIPWLCAGGFKKKIKQLLK